MSATQKHQRAFLAATLMTVIAVTTVFMVYAALLATITGSNVTVSTFPGTMYYSTDGGTSWDSNAISINNATSWYSRLIVTSAEAQSVTITWRLICSNSSYWDRVSYSTTLTVGSNTLYPNATSPTTGPGYNWGQDTDVLAASPLVFNVKATVTKP